MSTTRMDLRLLPYPEIYRLIFKDIVEIKPYGCLDRDKVMRELADYARLMEEVSRVYYEITNGKISKHNTLSEAVIAVYEDELSDLINETIEEEIQRHKCTCGVFKKEAASG